MPLPVVVERVDSLAIKQSDYYILGKPLYMDRAFESASEASRVIAFALQDAQLMESRGFYVTDFAFIEGKLKVRLGEDPTSV